MEKYIKYNDPGHGWLKVTISELLKLGIAEKISDYSYIKGSNAYLEEDCDLQTFYNAKKLNNENYKDSVKVRWTDNRSSIREYIGYNVTNAARAINKTLV